MIKNKINNYIRKSKEYSKKVVIAIVGNAKEITKVDEITQTVHLSFQNIMLCKNSIRLSIL